MNLKVLVEKNLGYSLFKEIENTKIQLSGADNSLFRFEKESISITKDVTIENYNELIEANINKIGNYLDAFLLKTKIAPAEIDTVFITGGSAQVRAIQQLILTRFGADKLRSGDYLNSVSEGLAWSYYN